MRSGEWCKQLGQPCSRCKRTDVEFTRRSYECVNCKRADWTKWHAKNADKERAVRKIKYHAEKANSSPAEFKRLQRGRQLWTKYRLTLDEYEALLAEQGGVCKICKTSDWATRDGSPCVDHDHAMAFPRSHGRKQVDKYPSGRPVWARDTEAEIKARRASVRGLLCSKCNTMLGSARDRADLLEAGVVYLAEHRRRNQ